MNTECARCNRTGTYQTTVTTEKGPNDNFNILFMLCHECAEGLITTYGYKSCTTKEAKEKRNAFFNRLEPIQDTLSSKLRLAVRCKADDNYSWEIVRLDPVDKYGDTVLFYRGGYKTEGAAQLDGRDFLMKLCRKLKEMSDVD